MKHLTSLTAAALFVMSSAIAGDIPANIQRGVDNPNRSEENSARDGDRKPGEVLAFFGVEEGMTVVDLFSSGGYFTEVLSSAVGPGGDVRAHNSAGDRLEERREALEAQYAPFGNITIDAVERGEPLPYADNSVDLVVFSLVIHHFHYNEDSGEVMPERSAAFYKEVKRVLKPGGVFGIIEHKAADGSTRAQSNDWHRIPEDVLKEDVTSSGLTFDGGADIHVNPEDDMKNFWGDTGLRGKTNRLVHRYVKSSE